MASRPVFKKDLMVPLLAASFLFRLAYLAAKWHTLAAGGMEYETLADSFLAHGRFLFAHNALGPVASAYMPPGVSFVLILAKGLWPSKYLFLLAALHLALASAALLLVGRVAERAGGPRAALAASVFYVLDINLFIPIAWVNETIYTMFLLLLAVHLTTLLDDEPSLGKASALGAVLGLGSLFRSTLVPQIGLSLFWLFSRRWRKARPYPMNVLGTAAFVFALTLAPWTIRNYRAFHKFVPVSQNLGMNLWCGWNPEGGGSEFALDGGPMPIEPELDKKLSAASSEPEWDRILKDSAFQTAADHPARWLKQRILSFLFFWHEHNFWAPKSPYRTPAWRLVGFLNIPFVLLFFVSAAGVWNMKGTPKYLLAVMAIHSLIHTLTHADIGSRYRYQIEPLMLVVISLFLAARRPDWGDRLERWVRFFVVAPRKELLQESVGDDK